MRRARSERETVDEHRIAVVIAGGGALGAWEAGAVGELLWAVEVLGRRGDRRWIVDVVTGASAGAVVAAMTARAILHDRPATMHAMREAWIEQFDARHLLGEPGRSALIDNAVLFDLARRYFRPGGPVALRRTPDALHPDLDSLDLGFSLANLVGVDYGIPLADGGATAVLTADGPGEAVRGAPPRGSPRGAGGDARIARAREPAGNDARGAWFTDTFFRDGARFTLDDRTRDAPDAWWTIARTAIASASYPLVFPPVPLLRTRADYPGALGPPFNAFPAQMAFWDGGVFDNEPLRAAIDMARRRDESAGASRRFVIVDPRLNRSRRDARFSGPRPLADEARRLLTMFAGEAVARDWLRACRVNARVATRDALVDALAETVRAVPAEGIAGALARAEAALASSTGHGATTDAGAPAGAGARATAASSVHADVATAGPDGLVRVLATHASAAARAGGEGDARATSLRQRLFAALVTLADAAGDLAACRVLRLHAVTGRPDETAGDALRSFLGFFDARLRDHDYRLGRRTARAALVDVFDGAEWPREEPPVRSRFDPDGFNPLYDPDPRWPDLGRAGVDDLPLPARERLERFLDDRTRRVVDALPVPGGAVGRWFARHVLGNTIRRRVLGGSREVP